MRSGVSGAAGTSVKAPSMSIAASSVSCGEKPANTSLRPGGAPVLKSMTANLPSRRASMRSARARKVNTLPSGKAMGSDPERSAWIVTISARRLRFPHDELGRETLEARPPLGIELGKGILDFAERVLAALQEVLQGARRQLRRIIRGEAAEDVVDDGPARGRARRRRDGLERVELEDVAGEDRIGIAHQRLDLRDAEGAREQGRVGLAAPGGSSGRVGAGVSRARASCR